MQTRPFFTDFKLKIGQQLKISLQGRAQALLDLCEKYANDLIVAEHARGCFNGPRCALKSSP
jgi:hypothetical protein